MALKDVLVYLDQSEHAFERLRLAADLARRHQSRLTALYVRELNPVQRHQQSIAELGQGTAVAIGQTNRQIRQSIDEASERMRSALEEIGREYELEIEWRCLDGVGSIIVPQHARFADLCVLSQDVSGAATATGYTFSEAEHLRRHGAPVTGVWLDEVSSESIAEAVQGEALKVGADLIVAGAFGHPRLWEKLMGGVTRDLLARMQLPVLMSY